MRKPNIIIINPDQMRADSLRHLGNLAAYTPTMDSIAQEGVSFKNAFCQNTVCVPSRCSFMTGLYPHVNGHRTMGNLLKRGEENLFCELRGQGYYVWDNNRGDLLVGNDIKWQRDCIDESYCANSEENKFAKFGRGEKGDDNYYSFFRGVMPFDDDYIVKSNDYNSALEATRFIKSYEKEQPFCLFLGLLYPHPPYIIEPKYYNLIDKNKLPKRINSIDETSEKSSMIKSLVKEIGVSKWSEERFDELRAVYLAMVAKVDDIVKMVIDALREKNIYDDSAIFIFSDHGDYTGDYGLTEKAQNSFEDCLVNVPLIIKLPKGYKVDCGINQNSMVELIDFYATAIDISGAKINHTQFGKSLVQSIANKNYYNRDYVTCEGGRNHDEWHCSENTPSVFGGDEYLPRKKVQASSGNEHTKATMLRTNDFKYVKRQYEKDELYDLKNDPNELNNIIDSKNYSEELVVLKEKMLSWYQETCDIVPFDIDQRFSSEKLFAMMKRAGKYKQAMLDELESRYKNGEESFFDILQVLKAKYEGDINE